MMTYLIAGSVLRAFFSGADERKEFVVVESRILCFFMLVGVIHWPSSSSESDNAKMSRDFSRDA